MTENEEKRLQTIKEKIAEMKAREQAIIARDKTRQRKDRTRRLIQNGALAEQYLNCKEILPDEFEELLKELVDFPEVEKIIRAKGIGRSCR